MKSWLGITGQISLAQVARQLAVGRGRVQLIRHLRSGLAGLRGRSGLGGPQPRISPTYYVHQFREASPHLKYISQDKFIRNVMVL